MLKVIYYIFIISAIMHILSCSESSPTETSAPVTEFILTFKQGGDYDITRDSIFVFFETTDSASVPRVEINGQFMTDFTSPADTMPFGRIFGVLHLPFSNSIDYSVSRDGNTTSGTTYMPLLPSAVHLNDIPIVGWLTNVPYSSSLQFTWECRFYDFFTYSLSLDNGYVFGSTTDTFLTIDIDNEYYGFYLWLGSAIGLDIKSLESLDELEPNIRGDYGNGYVTAYSDAEEYFIRFSD